MSQISEETRQTMREINRRVVSQAIKIRWKSGMPGVGERLSQYRGVGDDYDGTREYSPGDDPRHIDWNDYAASGGRDMLVKLFREPRDIRAFALVDVNISMNFGTQRVSKRVLAAELVTNFLKCLDETKDRVGAMFFSAGKLEKRIPSGSASRMLFPILASALQVEPTSQEGDSNGLAKALSALPSGRSLLLLVSDFLNMSEDDWSALRKAARRHDVICFYIQDLRERELPDVRWGTGVFGWLTGLLGCFYTLQDWTGARRTIWVSSKTRTQYARNFHEHEARIKARLKDCYIRAEVISTEEGDAAFPKILKTLGGHR